MVVIVDIRVVTTLLLLPFIITIRILPRLGRFLSPLIFVTILHALRILQVRSC